MTEDLQNPVVSVIITSYNHAQYLPKSIESAINQTYKNIEVIVVDDGSTDETKIVAHGYNVIYIYQLNKGLSAARNTGILHSSGVFLVFLDADDWLLPAAIATNLKYFSKNKKAAFISGCYQLISETENKIWDVIKVVEENHYDQLLQENYIGMHATVMYAKWVFDSLQYDTSLKACEDYDLYLNIAKKHTVFHHINLVAVYRIHTSNLSANDALMLKAALTVLNKQKIAGLDTAKKTLLQKGNAHFQSYYTQKIYDKVTFGLKGKKAAEFNDIFTLWRYNKSLFRLYIKDKAAGFKNLLSLMYRTLRKK